MTPDREPVGSQDPRPLGKWPSPKDPPGSERLQALSRAKAFRGDRAWLFQRPPSPRVSLASGALASQLAPARRPGRATLGGYAERVPAVTPVLSLASSSVHPSIVLRAQDRDLLSNLPSPLSWF